MIGMSHQAVGTRAVPTTRWPRVQAILSRGGFSGQKPASPENSIAANEEFDRPGLMPGLSFRQ